ncbi:MAG TPA: hypothetical protein VK464_26285 [Symbiobacteriaceae bacterium]|nr:hypothetical protein [Symbiobacteriaceae bacterium]
MFATGRRGLQPLGCPCCPGPLVGAFMYARATLVQGKGHWFLTGASVMAGLLVLSLLSDVAGLG